jgi:hypothetical protein
MEAAEERDELLLVFSKARQVSILDQVVGVLVMAGVADVMADIEQVAGGFEEACIGGVEAVQGAQTVEEFNGKGCSDFGVGERDAVALGEGLDGATEFVGELAATAGLASTVVEICNDAFADTGV